MASGRLRRVTHRHRTRALLVGRVDHSERDVIVTLFTEHLGKIGAVARGARHSQKRFAGCLEPLHTLMVELEEQPDRELLILSEARLERPRIHLMTRLSALEAAGQALRWVKIGAAERTAEPAVFALLSGFLEQLEDDTSPPARLLLAETGIGLLRALGWGLEFQRCIGCGRHCPPEKSAFVEPARGGIVCAECSGSWSGGRSRVRLAAAERVRLSRLAAGESRILQDADCDLVLQLVEQTLAAHGGLGSRMTRR